MLVWQTLISHVLRHPKVIIIWGIIRLRRWFIDEVTDPQKLAWNIWRVQNQLENNIISKLGAFLWLRLLIRTRNIRNSIEKCTIIRPSSVQIRALSRRLSSIFGCSSALKCSSGQSPTMARHFETLLFTWKAKDLLQNSNLWRWYTILVTKVGDIQFLAWPETLSARYKNQTDVPCSTLHPIGVLYI